MPEKTNDRKYRRAVVTSKTGEPRSPVDTPSIVARRWLEINNATRSLTGGQLTNAQLDENFIKAEIDIRIMDDDGPGDNISF